MAFAVCIKGMGRGVTGVPGDGVDIVVLAVEGGRTFACVRGAGARDDAAIEIGLEAVDPERLRFG